MDLNRADMKLLTECGYSGLLRGIDTDLSPIFDALDAWMPDQSAGPIGLALQALVAGDFERADEVLSGLVSSRREGRREAKAILAMCKALRKDMQAAEEIAEDLRGQGGSAESFSRLLVSSDEEIEAAVSAQREADEAAAAQDPEAARKMAAG